MVKPQGLVAHKLDDHTRWGKHHTIKALHISTIALVEVTQSSVYVLCWRLVKHEWVEGQEHITPYAILDIHVCIIIHRAIELERPICDTKEAIHNFPFAHSSSRVKATKMVATLRHSHTLNRRVYQILHKVIEHIIKPLARFLAFLPLVAKALIVIAHSTKVIQPQVLCYATTCAMCSTRGG